MGLNAEPAHFAPPATRLMEVKKQRSNDPRSYPSKHATPDQLDSQRFPEAYRPVQKCPATGRRSCRYSITTGSSFPGSFVLPTRMHTSGLTLFEGLRIVG